MDLPWWYFYKANTGTNFDNKYLDSVDLDGKIWKTRIQKKLLVALFIQLLK